MQITQPNIPSRRDGFALTITIVFLAVALLIFASIFTWANTNAVNTVRNNQYNMSENAAESAVERIIGQVDRDFVSASISNANAYATLPLGIDQTGWPITYNFSSTNGTTGTVDVVFGPTGSAVQPLNSQYAGLNGMAQDLNVYATATPVGQTYNVSATVHEALQFAYIPLFQFAIFYNVNLEIDPGAAMTVSGPVFCNQSIWEGSSVCTFASTVTAVGTNFAQIADPFATSYNGSGASTFAGGTPLNNANSLVMPIGTNNSPNAILGLLGLPPSPFNMGTSAAYSSNGIVYPANGADLVITNFASGTNDGTGVMPYGTNYIVYYQDSSLAQLPYDFFIITNNNNHTTYFTNYFVTLPASNTVYFAGFTWITNAIFRDWREGWNGGSGPSKRVEAVQIDMNRLNAWLNNTTNNGGSAKDALKLLHGGHHIDSVYVYNSVPLSTVQLPAVRLVNGKGLPYPGNSTFGFTVATPFPLYVWGDYNATNRLSTTMGGTNTTFTVPAALMGDSITILSDNWVDSYTNTGVSMPNASSTTVNAAMLEGIVASNPSISGNYSGGVENFMRLLEDWSGGDILTYNGSIVVLFYSQYATNSWQPTGNYYNPPTRKWAFDMNFKNPAKLPPLTPCSKAMIRGNWYAHK